MNVNQDYTSVWRDYSLSNDQINYQNIGDLHIWYKSAAKQLSVAYCLDSIGECEYSVTQIPESVEWNRWSLSNDVQKIDIMPVFPDRPVVVKPELKMKLLPNVKIKFYVRVPIWVRMVTQQTNSELTLLESPSVVLSSTWFGTPAQGELCYWITSGVQFQTEPDLTRYYSAICPINLSNKSDKELEITKLNIRVPKLSIFIDQQQLWSDDIKINYRGEEHSSQIIVSGKAPEERPSAVLLSKPRSDGKKSFTAKTFSTIKQLSSISLSKR